LCIKKIAKGCQAGNLLPLPRLYTDDIDNFGFRPMITTELKFMTKRKSLRNPQIQKLEPLLYGEDLSAPEWRNYIEVLATKLELNDYDWMNYKLFADVSTKEYGELKIEFAYFGAYFCEMKVENENVIYSFEFAGQLFQEYIVRYIQKYIKSWGETYTFNGAEEVIDFYNDVLTSPYTVEKSRQVIRRRKH
jgi:hypothetical protein